MVGIPFTRENASEMQKRAQAAKAARIQELRASLAAMRQPTEDFQRDALVRVRAQMRLILAKIDRELALPKLGTRHLKELVETLARFESMEQKLSMRAGPGSVKPESPKAKRSEKFSPPAPPDDPADYSNLKLQS